MNSFIKWPGGKAKLLQEMERNFPSNINSIETFIDPFGGAGTVTFHMAKYHNFKHIIYNDKVFALTECMQYIKDDKSFAELKTRLELLESMYNAASDKNEFYNNIRSTYNKMNKQNTLVTPILVCAYFIFLNKTCFNGLYRVNKNGEFNTPWNKTEKVKLFDRILFNEYHTLLQSTDTEILNMDYKDVLKKADTNTFIYIDPPYAPTDGSTMFTSYTSDGFSEENQKELAKQCSLLDERGIKFMLSNSYCDFILDLYKDYNICEVFMPRSINSKGDGRGLVSEVLIKNY